LLALLAIRIKYRMFGSDLAAIVEEKKQSPAQASRFARVGAWFAIGASVIA
jgi:hypothetical protein